MQSRFSRLMGLFFGVLLFSYMEAAVAYDCTSPPANPIVDENCQTTGVQPQSVWDISGAGSTSIQGFATDISVNQGGTVNFKIKTNQAYRIDIYRMGYYGGNGARKVATIPSSGTLPSQSQPACLTDSSGLIDCGNWTVSASWPVPPTAVSGIYFAKIIRTDNAASHIFFVVRNDASNSDILFQTSDTTWQAYNDYGGNNLYTSTNNKTSTSNSVGRAYKVSYNRPFHTRVYEPESWVFNGEYPMVRWLEAHGYNVTYFTGVDADRNGALIKNHKIWMSNGHDEYWSGTERANVQAALAAGVNLAFFSGNKIFWKTRWETSIDSSHMPYRTLVCYKETQANTPIDPLDKSPTWTWTGTWRDPRFSPPADGGHPENAVGGTLFRINGPYNDVITVSAEDGKMRFWRNSGLDTLSAGSIESLAPGTLGAEVDVDEDNGFRPPGLFGVSTNPINTSSQYLLDYGSSYGAGSATHRVTLYRHSSGALVFSTGSYQWSWGLDAHHDRSNQGSATDVRMQQATINLFADMGVQPVSWQEEPPSTTELTHTSQSSDFIAPTSAISSPTGGSTLPLGSQVTISGTAADTGGVVGGVEVSVDGGTTWHPAIGRASWTYAWTTPSTSSSVMITSRAVDDSGNLGTPSAGVTVTIGGGGTTGGGGGGTSTGTTIFTTQTPSLFENDLLYELGTKFYVTPDPTTGALQGVGNITTVRLYTNASEGGDHTVRIWRATDAVVVAGPYTWNISSGTAGWKTFTLPTPLLINANTDYIVAISNSSSDQYYAELPNAFPITNGRLVAAQNSGVYTENMGTMPTLTWQNTSYFRDVVFVPK